MSHYLATERTHCPGALSGETFEKMLLNSIFLCDLCGKKTFAGGLVNESMCSARCFLVEISGNWVYDSEGRFDVQATKHSYGELTDGFGKDLPHL